MNNVNRSIVMTEQQRSAHTEMLLRRVVTAESALRTIREHHWKEHEWRAIAKRALSPCEEFTDRYVKQYPD